MGPSTAIYAAVPVVQGLRFAGMEGLRSALPVLRLRALSSRNVPGAERMESPRLDRPDRYEVLAWTISPVDVDMDPRRVARPPPPLDEEECAWTTNPASAASLAVRPR